MTNRIHALTVVLESDTRDDDIESLVEAIKHLRNVADVKLHVTDLSDFSARTRARQELSEKLWQVLYQKDAA